MHVPRSGGCHVLQVRQVELQSQYDLVDLSFVASHAPPLETPGQIETSVARLSFTALRSLILTVATAVLDLMDIQQSCVKGLITRVAVDMGSRATREKPRRTRTTRPTTGYSCSLYCEPAVGIDSY